MAYTVERGIPLPDLKYPYEDMLVGDSFFIMESAFNEGVWEDVQTELYRYKERNHWEDEGIIYYAIEKHQVKGGTRIWRVR